LRIEEFAAVRENIRATFESTAARRDGVSSAAGGCLPTLGLQGRESWR
jgi:hypothetical protein